MSGSWEGGLDPFLDEELAEMAEMAEMDENPPVSGGSEEGLSPNGFPVADGLFPGENPKLRDFPDALAHVLAGGGARRVLWGAGSGIVCLTCAAKDHHVPFDPFLAYVAGERAMVWMPLLVDMFADDWRLIDGPPGD